MQVKTEKLIKLLNTLNINLVSDNDISLHVEVKEDSVDITYLVCVRRDYPLEVAQRFSKKLNTFVNIINSSSLSNSKKMKKFKSEIYDDEYNEYTEYEIDIRLNYTIKIGKKQNKFIQEEWDKINN